MNRFYDTPGDLCRQLAPWELKARGYKLDVPLFELQEEIHFRSDIAGGVITVPVGYLSDLASIPRFAWSIFMAPDDPRIELGAWVHDLLYQKQGQIYVSHGLPRTDGPTPLYPVSLTRQQCDAILAHEAMADLGANAFQRSAVYGALRTFGDRWK